MSARNKILRSSKPFTILLCIVILIALAIVSYFAINMLSEKKEFHDLQEAVIAAYNGEYPEEYYDIHSSGSSGSTKYVFDAGDVAQHIPNPDEIDAKNEAIILKANEVEAFIIDSFARLQAGNTAFMAEWNDLRNSVNADYESIMAQRELVLQKVEETRQNNEALRAAFLEQWNAKNEMIKSQAEELSAKIAVARAEHDAIKDAFLSTDPNP